MRRKVGIVYLKSRRMGWNFERVIWRDERGEYVKLKGLTDLSWALDHADDFEIIWEEGQTILKGYNWCEHLGKDVPISTCHNCMANCYFSAWTDEEGES